MFVLKLCLLSLLLIAIDASNNDSQKRDKSSSSLRLFESHLAVHDPNESTDIVAEREESSKPQQNTQLSENSNSDDSSTEDVDESTLEDKNIMEALSKRSESSSDESETHEQHRYPFRIWHLQAQMQRLNEEYDPQAAYRNQQYQLHLMIQQQLHFQAYLSQQGRFQPHEMGSTHDQQVPQHRHWHAGGLPQELVPFPVPFAQQSHEHRACNNSVARKSIITVSTQFLHNMQILENAKEVSAADHESVNTVFSPFIIDLPLSYLFVVAKNQTLNEFVTLMENNAEKNVSLMIKQHSKVLKRYQKVENSLIAVASKIWINPKIAASDEYLQKIGQSETDMIAELKSVGSKDMINMWVSQETNGKIGKIIEEEIDLNDPERQGFLLTSAIFFDGKFTSDHKFKTHKTRTDDFFVSDDFDSFPNIHNHNIHVYDKLIYKTVNVKMMRNQGRYGYVCYKSESRKYEIVELKYESNVIDTSLLIVKPLNNNAWVNPLNMNDIFGRGNVIDSLKYESKEMELILPKFKFKTRIDLKQALMNLGIKDAFSSLNANFDGFGTINGTSETSDKDEPFKFYISEATQIAGIDVFEEGTIAYAASVWKPVILCASPPPAPIFKVNRPFHAYIIDKTNKLVLFYAKVRQPTITNDLPQSSRSDPDDEDEDY